jgi:carotenoid 1,2-hydratase
MAGVVHAGGLAQRDSGPVFGGRQHASGAGGAHGGDLRTPGRSVPHDGFRFDCAVPANGYVWWYCDALSDDGAYGLTLIAFIGSVFSPYYAWARRGDAADPANHCAVNVALYGRRGARWAMTERGAGALRRDASRLSVGPSHLAWDGAGLDIEIDERCAPIPRRLQGRIRLIPTAMGDQSFMLDGAGKHLWTPFAPCARVEVRLSEPSLSWSGSAYLDSNFGNEPLEDAFQEWTWSRASVPQGTVVLYDVTSRREGDPHPEPLALHFDSNGAAEILEPPPRVGLPATRWRVARHTRADAGHAARVVQTLEDAPFYSRSLLETRLLGSVAPAIHESLNLDRFRSRWVQCLLPFRMPRNPF